MNVRRGRTVLLPISLRQGTDERGQIASTIWAEESGGRVIERGYLFEDCHFLPTRLSTKVTFRSHCRTKEGGHVVALDLRGCWRCSGQISTAESLFLGQCMAMGSQEDSMSEDPLVTEESSDTWEE